MGGSPSRAFQPSTASIYSESQPIVTIYQKASGDLRPPIERMSMRGLREASALQKGLQGWVERGTAVTLRDRNSIKEISQ